MQRKARRAARIAAPVTEPMTIPAIAPPERPWLAAAVEVAEDEGVSGGRVEVGTEIPSHRLVALDFLQQVSLSFAQYVQRPIVFDAKPQLSGSFAAPSIQSPERALDGFSQITRSE